MKSLMRTFCSALGASLVVSASLLNAGVGVALAHDGHDHGGGAGARHGGVEAKTKNYHFEAVIAAQGVKLYVHGTGPMTVDARGLAATATFFHPNKPDQPWFSRPLKVAAGSSPGRPAESLDLAVDLSKVPATGGKVVFRVSGLPVATEPSAEFTVALAFAKPGGLTVAKATKGDQAAVAKLKLCPVSGEDLESMGGALKVSRGDQATFICCKGCLKKIEADPAKYFAGLGKSAAPAAKPDHEHHD